MGNGAWSDNTYQAASTFRRARGIDDFTYTSTLFSLPRAQWAADPTLDPFGVGMRESRDSAEHPNSTPIAVLFDVTGSMGAVPRIMQTKLGQLHGLLQRKGYLQDPQIMFGGIGDADTDRVPLQIGQFESDNRMDDQLRTIFLEGNGGGQKSESYELATYFIARHTVTDAWEKRGRKGYLFIVGDELNKPVLTAGKLRQVLGEPAREDSWMSPTCTARSSSAGTPTSSCRTSRTTTPTGRSASTGARCWASDSSCWTIRPRSAS